MDRVLPSTGCSKSQAVLKDSHRNRWPRQESKTVSTKREEQANDEAGYGPVPKSDVGVVDENKPRKDEEESDEAPHESGDQKSNSTMPSVVEFGEIGQIDLPRHVSNRGDYLSRSSGRGPLVCIPNSQTTRWIIRLRLSLLG